MGLEQYDSETVEKAFWLQRKIKRDGIDAIRYMEAAEQFAEKHGAPTVAASISLSLRKL